MTKKETKSKQIVVRFDTNSYQTISEHAEIEHRGLGEFVRHATLFYIEYYANTMKKNRTNNAQ